MNTFMEELSKLLPEYTVTKSEIGNGVPAVDICTKDGKWGVKIVPTGLSANKWAKKIKGAFGRRNGVES